MPAIHGAKLTNKGGVYDKIICFQKVFKQKLNYIHTNPVLTGFVTNPID